MQHILIATHHLENYAGTEIVALELASEFKRRGSNVTVGSFIVGDPIRNDFRRAGITVLNIFDETPADIDYDLIWVSHRPVYEYLFGKMALRARRVVYSTHSPYESLEALPEDLSAVDLVLVNSPETGDAVRAEPRANLPPQRLLSNFAPDDFFEHPRRTIDTLGRLAIVSNHPPKEVLDAVPLLRASGVDVDIIGLGHAPRRVTPEILGRYDAIVSIGKTVQYAFALGIPVYCYDRFGGPGWMAPDQADALEYVNYSGRGAASRDAPELCLDIVEGFPPALSHLDELRSLAFERYRLSARLDRVLTEIAALPERAGTARPTYSRANDYYISELRGRLYLAHINRVNEHALEMQATAEAERDQMRQALASALTRVASITKQATQYQVRLDDANTVLSERDRLVFQLSKLLSEDVQFFAAIRQAALGGKKPLLSQTVNKATDAGRVAGIVDAMNQVKAIVQGKKQLRIAESVEGADATQLDGLLSNSLIGIMAHVFYIDLFPEIRDLLARFPYPFTLLVSVVDQAAADSVRAQSEGLDKLVALDVRVVENRGRDLAPLFVTFRDAVLSLDLVCHIHTKKSLYTGEERVGWRQYLYRELLGNPERISAILRRFAATPSLGLVYPESYSGMPFWGHTWLQNKPIGMMLAQRLGYDIDLREYLDYPAGSMFWARTQSLRPLFDLNLRLDQFPPESGQTDGTLQHALERYLTIVPRLCGYEIGVIGKDGSVADTGEKNWQHYFVAPLAGKLEGATAKARILSVDIFDTLIMRPFLHPDAVFDFIGEFMRVRHGIADFKALRKQAEARGRVDKQGKDVDLEDIYRALAALVGGGEAFAAEAREIEQGMELWFVRPRAELIRLLKRVAAQGKRIVAVSDMYLPKALIGQMLDRAGIGFISEIYVSNDTGWRKDTGEAWRRLPEIEGVAADEWLHIGDNEHSDIQLTVAAKYMMPLHVLRPSALLETVPCLRPLHRRGTLAWPDQLWLGLLANRLSDIADRYPNRFGKTLRFEDAESIGYLCFGPIVANYILWVAREAVRQGIGQLLFLSREGYLLEKAFNALRAALPYLSSIDTSYFLTSRRASGVAAMRNRDDLTYLLGAHFQGTLSNLLEARLGANVLAAYELAGDVDLDAKVCLPDMKRDIVERLLGSRADILDVAGREREAYLEYWRREVTQEKVALCDLGFSGTIQKFLMGMTGRKMDGYYFVTTRKVEGLKQLGVAVRGLYGESVSLEETSVPAFDYSLLLEAVLTAPAGQFLCFEGEGATLRPVFKDAGHAQAHFDKIGEIQQGILSFIDDLVEAVGERVYDAEFDKSLVQLPLKLIIDGVWSLGPMESLFSVEDDFSGSGEISCIAHYRMLEARRREAL
ncbi:MAG: hypothetical protein IPG66_02045 [Hydrogenophilales bacterium]|nr:hypothetical protein [Hydrogenophilales bacterium]